MAWREKGIREGGSGVLQQQEEGARGGAWRGQRGSQGPNACGGGERRG